MKLQLNLVAATMSVLGMISFPVYANEHAKSKHHHHKKTHHVAKHEVAENHAYKDYKDMGPAQPPVCTISPYTISMYEMTQNVGRSMPNPCNPGWYNRIRMSGGINLDLGKFGSRGTDFMGVNYERFSINDVYLNVTADVNDWVKAFASLNFETATINDPAVDVASAARAEYSAAYANNITSGSSNAIQMEQGIITIGNMNESPLFLQLGKQFQDHSRYMIHPITRTVTQVMSETLATSAKLGFMYNGFNGSVSVFDNPIVKQNESKKATNYVLALGYDQNNDELGFDLGVSYMRDMIGTNDVAYRVNQVMGVETAGNITGYRTRVASMALYGDVNSGPFSLGARYTRALDNFNNLDLPDTLNGATLATGNFGGAKPWAAGITAGYDFQAWDRTHNIYVGWQGTHDAVALSLPQHRWLAGWNANVWGDNTTVGIEWDRDSAYGTGRGGSGNNSNLVSVRVGAKFA